MKHSIQAAIIVAVLALGFFIGVRAIGLAVGPAIGGIVLWASERAYAKRHPRVH